jgi:hypothetical protein
MSPPTSSSRRGVMRAQATSVDDRRESFDRDDVFAAVLES